jgi:predicted secreted hydrolase
LEATSGIERDADRAERHRGSPGRDGLHVRDRGGTTWTSPDSGATYPALWRIGVPSAGIDVSLAPIVANQERTPLTTGGSPYWNGAVEVRDVPNDGALLGWGRAELTGYVRPLSL